MLPDATVVTGDTVELLLRFSFQHAVPIFSFSKKYVEMGAVASLDVDPYDMGVQAAEILSKVAAHHSDAIRVYARKSHLTVNKNVAAKMGLPIRDEVLKKVNNGNE
jgi:putative ABC transport system substrate-binding protein